MQSTESLPPRYQGPSVFALNVHEEIHDKDRDSRLVSAEKQLDQ